MYGWGLECSRRQCNCRRRPCAAIQLLHRHRWLAHVDPCLPPWGRHSFQTPKPKTLSFCFKQQQQASRGDPPEHAACNWRRSSGTTQKKPRGRRVTWSFCASSLSRLSGLKASRSIPPQSERMWTYTENGAAAARSRFHSTHDYTQIPSIV